MCPLPDSDDSSLAPVLFVKRRDAKELKNALEAANLIDPDRRMGAADPTAFSRSPRIGEATWEECICIPVTEKCVRDFEEYQLNEPTGLLECKWAGMVVKAGRQHCRASASAIAKAKQGGGRRRRRESNKMQQTEEPLTLVQQALVEMLMQQATAAPAPQGSKISRDEIEQAVISLSSIVCPRKLERFGDDRSLVIPRTAFRLDDDKFRSLIESFLPIRNNRTDIKECLNNMWPILAQLYSSPRVVRRGDIDPESKIRESGHRILYPDTFDVIEPGIPSTAGPGSPGWIRITEHGIRQSFDLTRVMFSRGNVTEKVRFGRELVQSGEVVLDMYTGIGFYTLPALILGKAAHVYCCEWNPDAIAALRFNLKDNGVEYRAEILEGDSRLTAPQAGIIGIVDRVSLGLLPSSEGGWKVAIEALRQDKGGWLHVHGNVPTTERKKWSLWICHRLAQIADELGRSEWVAICQNMEKVKSFAPKVDHYVADVFVGPKGSSAFALTSYTETGVLSKDGTFEACAADVETPSCALNRDGILHQEWMM